MQRPPDSRRPPILFQRPTYEWINRVTQKHKEMAAFQLSAEQKLKLDRWVEAEFAYSTLMLEEASASKAEVFRFVSSPARDEKELRDSDRVIWSTIASLRIVETLARSSGRAAVLTPELLLRLHGTIIGASTEFRASGGDANRSPKPQQLTLAVDAACRWFTAESFTELNPVEQASIVLLRLIELEPFEIANERTVLLAASLFTLRSGLPPLIITPDRAAAYRGAIDEGFRANTKPMVELLAETIEATLAGMIETAKTR